MSSIFGIVNLKGIKVNESMFNLMKDAASYKIPRKLSTVKTESAIIASAVGHHLKSDQSIVTLFPWILIGDCSLYKKNELISHLSPTSLYAGNFSDCELLLKSWIKWGKKLTNYIYGDFSFVVFNNLTGEIYAVRDKIGIRPLFYFVSEEYFAFASELRLLSVLFTNSLKLRYDYLLNTLISIKEDKHLTPFNNIYRLPPASIISIIKGKSEIVTYWDLKISEISRLTHEDYVEMYKNALINSVKIRCNYDHICGSELSGGLDSSFVTAASANYMRHDSRLIALSNTMPLDINFTYHDESEYIQTICEKYKLEYRSVYCNKKSIPHLLKMALDVQASFIQQNFSIYNQALYECAADNGVVILFSGFGGDELPSSIVPFPWNELIDKREWEKMYSELTYDGTNIRSLIRALNIISKYLEKKTTKRSKLFFNSDYLRARFKNLPLKSAFVKENRLMERFLDSYAYSIKETLAEVQLSRISSNYIPQRIEYCYAAAAQYGIEYRYPLLDTDLIEKSLALPPWLKIHHGVNRYIFREAIKGLVPERIRLRNDKSGDPIPHKRISLKRDRDQIIQLIINASNTGYFDSYIEFPKMFNWYENIILTRPDSTNPMISGLLDAYLMIFLYYLHGNVD